MTDHKKTATDLVDGLPFNVEEGQPKIITQCGGRNVLIDRITSALTAAASVGKGCMRDEHGVERKVLGTLPLTADGCVAGIGAEVYYENNGGNIVSLPLGYRLEISDTPEWDGHEYMYSTLEAAQAARGGNGGTNGQ